MISILDYGMGNIGSLINMLSHLGIKSKIIQTPEDVVRSEKLILPGVGSFDSAINQIDGRNLREPLEEMVQSGRHILGICLGMQLLTKSSEEGNSKGFGWIDASTLSFNKVKDDSLKVPHMGWNVVRPCFENPLSGAIMFSEDRFYFVHSYYVKCNNRSEALAETDYGIRFDSVIAKENILGVQFHPEKSHKFGMSLLKKYSDL